MNTTDMMNTTGSSGLSTTMRDYFDRKLLAIAKKNLVYAKDAQKRPLPKNNGKTINFRKWDKLAEGNAHLKEGLTPKGQELVQSSITASINQYGKYLVVTDLLESTSFDNVVNGAMERLGDQAAETMDSVTRDIICTGTNRMYAGNAINRMGIEPTAKLTVDEIRKAKKILDRADTPKFTVGGKGYYKCVVGPETIFDLQGDEKWNRIQDYATPENRIDGEVGRIFGVVFIETTHDKRHTATRLTISSYSSATKTITFNEPIPTNIKNQYDDEIANPIAALLAAGKKIYIASEAMEIASFTASPTQNAATVVLKDTPANAPVENSTAYLSDGGKNGITIANTLMYGKDAYGDVDLDGNIKMITKAPESGGTEDPLNQRSTIAWKVHGYTAKILQHDWLLSIEHAVTE